MSNRKEWPDLSLFTLFAGHVSPEAKDQRLFLSSREKQSIQQVSWNVMRFAATLRLCMNARQSGDERTAAEHGRMGIELKKFGTNPDRYAMSAIEKGQVGMVTGLCSHGGSCETMQTVLDGMSAVEAAGGNNLTVGRKTISSAAAMFIFGEDRWIESGTEAMFHGRVNALNESPSPGEMRARALGDFETIYKPRFSKISRTFRRHRLIGRRLRAAEADQENHRLEFSMPDDLLIQSGIATAKFESGSSLWRAIHSKTRVGKAVSQSRNSDHPVAKFFNAPAEHLLDEE